MLAPKDLGQLLSLLSEEEKSLESIATTFHKLFAKTELFKVGCTLYLMLQDGLLPKTTQRLSAFFVLYELYRSEPLASNPFLPIFIDSLSRKDPSVPTTSTSTPSPASLTGSTGSISSATSTQTTSTPPPLTQLPHSSLRLQPAERNFLIHLIASPTKELLKKTLKEIVQTASPQPSHLSHLPHSPSSPPTPSPLLPLPDLNPLYKVYLDRQPGVSPLKKHSISPFLPPEYFQSVSLPSPTVSSLTPEETQQEEPTESGETESETQSEESKEFVLHNFEPYFIRPAPPLFDFRDDECEWLTPENIPEPLWWDKNLQEKESGNGSVISSSDVSNKGDLKFKELFSKALTARLTTQEQQTLANQLDKEPSLVFESGLTPSKLPQLVELNPLVATECLLKLMNSSDITEYFSVLVNMDTTIHAMEVVNALTKSMELPNEFLQVYISNCLSCCENTRDKTQQTRLVRLVSVFLKSLIENKALILNETQKEIQAFCVDFANVREAAALFRLLRNMEN